MLKESHVLEGEEGDLVLWLVYHGWHAWVLALEARLDAMTAGWLVFLTLDSPPLAVVTPPPTLGVALSLQSLPAPSAPTAVTQTTGPRWTHRRSLGPSPASMAIPHDQPHLRDQGLLLGQCRDEGWRGSGRRRCGQW